MVNAIHAKEDLDGLMSTYSRHWSRSHVTEAFMPQIWKIKYPIFNLVLGNGEINMRICLWLCVQLLLLLFFFMYSNLILD